MFLQYVQTLLFLELYHVKKPKAYTLIGQKCHTFEYTQFILISYVLIQFYHLLGILFT